MAKNMTRKGLAIGASVALAAAGVVGISSPAMADSNIYLVPAVGGAEQNRVPIEQDFTLKTYHGTSANGLAAPVSVQVEDADENLEDVVLSAAGSASDQPEYDSDEGAWTGGAINDQDAGITAPETITLKPKAADDDSETFSVIVTTWFDNGNGTIDGTETQASQEIFFHVDDDYDWVIDFTKPELGDTALEATVSTTVPSINLAMFAGNWGVGFASIDTANNDVTGITADSSSSTSSTTKRLGKGTAASDSSEEYDLDSNPAGASADFVDFNSDGTVDFKVAVDDGSDDKIVEGTYLAAVVFDAASSPVAPAVDAALTNESGDEVARSAALVEEATVEAVKDPALAASTDTNPTNGNIRVDTDSVTIESEAYSDNSSTPKKTVGAGVVGTVKIEKGSPFDEDSELTAGGETLTDSTSPAEITFDIETNADGEFSFSVDTSDLIAGDKFAVTITSQDQDSSTETFTVEETVPANFVEHNLLGEDADWKVEHGDYTLLFAATDNFGQPLVGSEYQVLLDNQSGLSTSEDIMVSGLSNGVASFNVNTKDSDGDTVSSFVATLRALDGGDYNPVASMTDEVVVNIGASEPAANVTVGDGTDVANEDDDFQLPISVSSNSDSYDLALEDFADANTRLGEFNDVSTEGTSAALTLQGQIADSNGIATYGDVTVSGEGLMFRAAGPEGDVATALPVYAVDSITVQTSTLGAYKVDVFSNTAGKVDVTVSSGDASQTATLVFDSAADTTGDELTIDAPSAVAPGATLQYTATLVDEYGNPVAGGSGTSTVKVNYDGPGFVVGTLPDEFGADGSITVSVFLGNNDGGKTGTLTVSYTPGAETAATYAFDGDDDLVVQKTVNIGNVPSPSTGGEFNAWTKLIDNDTAVKFYAKNPSNQGKIQFFFNGEEIAWHRGTSPTSYEGGEPRYNVDQDAYYLVRDVELVSGMKNVFEIEQDGERIWRAVKTLD